MKPSATKLDTIGSMVSMRVWGFSLVSVLAGLVGLICALLWLLGTASLVESSRRESAVDAAAQAAQLIAPLHELARIVADLDPSDPVSEASLRRAQRALSDVWLRVKPRLQADILDGKLAKPEIEFSDSAGSTMSRAQAFQTLQAAFDTQAQVLARLSDLELRAVDTKQLHAQTAELIDGLVRQSERFLARLARIEAEPSQYEAATRQLILTHRLQAQLVDLREHDERARSAIDTMGREAVALGDLNTRLRTEPSGPTAVRIEDQSAERLLAGIGQDFRNLANLVEPLANDLLIRLTIATAGEDLRAPLQDMSLAIARLSQVAPRGAEKADWLGRWRDLIDMKPMLAALSLACLALLLFSAIGLVWSLLVEGRQLQSRFAALSEQARLTEQARADTLTALNGVLMDINRLTSGAYKLDAQTGRGPARSKAEQALPPEHSLTPDNDQPHPDLSQGVAEDLHVDDDAGVSPSDSVPVTTASASAQTGDTQPSSVEPSGALVRSADQRWQGMEAESGGGQVRIGRMIASIQAARDGAEREAAQLYQASKATYASAASVETLAHFVARAGGAVEDMEQQLHSLSESIQDASRHSERAESDVSRAVAQARVVEQTSRELGLCRQSLHELEELARLLSTNAAMQSASIGGHVLQRLAEDASRLADAANDAVLRLGKLTDRANLEAGQARAANSAALEHTAAARQEMAAMAETLSRSMQSMDRYTHAETAAGRALREHMADIADVVRGMRLLNDHNRELGQDLRNALLSQSVADQSAARWMDANTRVLTQAQRVEQAIGGADSTSGPVQPQDAQNPSPQIKPRAEDDHRSTGVIGPGDAHDIDAAGVRRD